MIFSISYARDRRSYRGGSSSPQPAGQAIVRQAYLGETRDGEQRHSDLFIMYKADGSAPGTDAGWTYARVAPDRKTIREFGALSSCMSCHREKADRIFGP